MSKQLTPEIPDFIERVPLISDWCEYKGEVFFAIINYERTMKARRVMLDLCYCATRALNGLVLKTVQWNPKKFDPWMHSTWTHNSLTQNNSNGE